jgi:hypothetical protein
MSFAKEFAYFGGLKAGLEVAQNPQVSEEDRYVLFSDSMKLPSEVNVDLVTFKSLFFRVLRYYKYKYAGQVFQQIYTETEDIKPYFG